MLRLTIVSTLRLYFDIPRKSLGSFDWNFGSVGAWKEVSQGILEDLFVLKGSCQIRACLPEYRIGL